MVLAVGHQNVPRVINNNPGRVVELASFSSGGPKWSSDRLEIVGVENVDLIQTKIVDIQFALGEGQEPALGVLMSVPS